MSGTVSSARLSRPGRLVSSHLVLARMTDQSAFADALRLTVPSGLVAAANAAASSSLTCWRPGSGEQS